tara:strand:- start:5961 stop:7640 length:1680 start_codon:yes stop_codon:yes gene_type:complete
MAKVLVTDGGYPHSLGIIRSLAKLGHHVDCIGNGYCLSRFSRYLNKCIYKQSNFKSNNIGGFIEFLRRNNYDYLIPVGAESVRYISNNRKLISQYVIINLASNESIEKCLSKIDLLNYAISLEIPVPRIYTNDYLDDFISKNNYIPSKLVIKSKSEIYKNKKVKYISNINQYIKNYSYSKNNLIQEYIEGYGIGFFAVYYHGKLKNYFMHKRIRENPPSGGSSVCATSIFDKQAFDYGTNLLNKLNWHGVAMVEFKKNQNNRQLYLMEVNPKFWGSYDLSMQSGINFAKEYIDISGNIEFKEVIADKNSIPYKTNIRFQWLAQDIKANLFKPFLLIKAIYEFIYLRTPNNLWIKDPLATIYLLLLSVFTPLLKSNFFKLIFTIIYRLKSIGIKVTLIRLITEVSGVPILQYSEISENIAIGMQLKYFGFYLLLNKGYTCILNLRSEFELVNKLSNSFTLLRIPIDEYAAPSFKQLDKASDLIHNSILSNKKIYVHCREGISRAPSCLAAYFIKYQKLSLQESIERIKSTRYFINILPNQMESLIQFEIIINSKYLMNNH